VEHGIKRRHVHLTLLCHTSALLAPYVRVVGRRPPRTALTSPVALHKRRIGLPLAAPFISCSSCRMCLVARKPHFHLIVASPSPASAQLHLHVLVNEVAATARMQTALNSLPIRGLFQFHMCWNMGCVQQQHGKYAAE
jgi:hypothetical protein